MREAHGTSVLREVDVHFGRAIGARVLENLVGGLEKQSVVCGEDLQAMSDAGVASRGADSVPLQAAMELPVRLYMRALRQYQKLLDLRRFASKDKVSNYFLSLEIFNFKPNDPFIYNCLQSLTCN